MGSYGSFGENKITEIFEGKSRCSGEGGEHGLYWKPPHDGGFKLYFDGSSKGNLGLEGFGCVIRDHNGSIIRVICGSLGICNFIKAETIGLLMGFRELKKWGLRSVSLGVTWRWP